MLENLKEYNIVLASKSPRRRELLKELGLEFEINALSVDEDYPADLPADQIARYLSEKKADAYLPTLSDKELIITADTVVICDDAVLGKPKDYADAMHMLMSLSGRCHQVVTGVTLLSAQKRVSFSVSTEVYFAEISEDPNTAIGKNLIRPKFIDKWTRIYDTLITKQYDPLKDYDYEEHRGGNNSDTTTYNISVEDNGKTGTKETVTTSRDTSNDVYGFNSSVPVGDDTSTENMTETTEGLANDNTTYNKQDKTGTDSKAFTIDEDVTKSARNVSGADLVQSELNLRNKQIFFDIVYADIDSIFALSVYG